MRKLVLFISLVSVITGCTSIRLKYEADIVSSKDEGASYTYSFEKSYSTRGLAIACWITGILYGGVCWGYLGKPYAVDSTLLAEDAHKDLVENQKLTDFKVGSESVQKVSWEGGAPIGRLVPLATAIKK
jgi:hypothetical protein